MVAAARRGGLAVSVEASINHALLTDAALATYDTNCVFRPPLRPEHDRLALVAAFLEGGVDVLSCDHAPQPSHLKEVPVDAAEPGAIGLETALALALGRLGLPLSRLGALLSWGPASLVGLRSRHGGPIEVGRPANLCVVDPPARWTWEPSAGTSRPATAPMGAGSWKDGYVTRSWTANPSSSTPRPNVERTRSPGGDMRRPTPAWLVLADGTTFEGDAVGWEPPDGVSRRRGGVQHRAVRLPGGHHRPSYAGQIITFTYPHIGNYGVTPPDDESRPALLPGGGRPRPAPAPLQLAGRPGRSRSSSSPSGIPVITGVDTRRLTRHLRDRRRAALRLRDRRARPRGRGRRRARGTDGADFVSEVSTAEPYRWPHRRARAYGGDRGRRPRPGRGLRLRDQDVDAGQLGELGEVDVVPASTPAADVLARRPDGVFLSNGPGDPAALRWAVDDDRPTWSGGCRSSGSASATSCSAAALGGATFKLPFGHHGGNHPVGAGRGRAVEITSQNHNYAVVPSSLARRRGHPREPQRRGRSRACAAPDRWCFCVQYHPEAGPGPHDARYLFGSSPH